MKVDIKTIWEDSNSVRHNFKIYNTEDANINDFHLFCLSIVRDLINDKHKIDQFMGTYKYNFDFDEEEIEGLIDVMNYMSDVIFRERMAPTKLSNGISNN